MCKRNNDGVIDPPRALATYNPTYIFDNYRWICYVAATAKSKPLRSVKDMVALSEKAGYFVAVRPFTTEIRNLRKYAFEPHKNGAFCEYVTNYLLKGKK